MGVRGNEPHGGSGGTQTSPRSKSLRSEHGVNGLHSRGPSVGRARETTGAHLSRPHTETVRTHLGRPSVRDRDPRRGPSGP